MPGLSRKLVLFVALVLALPALVSPVRAHDGPAAAASAKEAAAALQSYSDQARKAGRRPDFTAAPAAEWLRVVFDSGRLDAMPEPVAKDMEWAMDWADASNASYKQLIMVGLTPGQPPDEAILARNMTDYEDPIASGISFMIRLMAREMNASVLFMSELPKEQVTRIRLEGFRGMRSGFGAIFQGALCVVAHGMKPANARMVMAAMDQTRATWAGALDPADKASAMAWLKQITTNAGDKEVMETAAVLLTTFATEK